MFRLVTKIPRRQFLGSHCRLFSDKVSEAEFVAKDREVKELLLRLKTRIVVESKSQALTDDLFKFENASKSKDSVVEELLSNLKARDAAESQLKLDMEKVKSESLTLQTKRWETQYEWLKFINSQLRIMLFMTAFVTGCELYDLLNPKKGQQCAYCHASLCTLSDRL